MRWDLERVAAITGGRAAGAAEVDSVVTDSRHASAGSLFVALPGEHHDGHDFWDDARGRGAAAILCSRGRLPGDAVGVEVDDTLEALRLLGTARRAELDVPVVAITGSSGKTTTKDLTAAVLGAGTHAAPRSYNNEVGVPLTILSAPDDATAIVAEVGSRGRGHITGLAPVVRPDVSVITNIGRAHLEQFGSLEGVRAAKWEIVEALGPDGVAVLPHDDDALVGRRSGPLITFGEGPGADVAAVDIALDGRGVASCTLVHRGERETVTMPLPGHHQPRNAAAAVAVAVALGRPFAASVRRLTEARVSPWRMETTTVPVEGGSVTVVNDAYNANPDSMASALRTVGAMPGRHIAVLGMMHELGDEAGDAHREIGAMAASLGFEVVAVGDEPGIADGAGAAAVRVDGPEDALSLLREILAPGDVVLVKASRAAGLERVAAGLEGVAS